MSESESSDSSDLCSLMDLSDWDGDDVDEEEEQTQKTYKNRINYMSELQCSEFTYRFRLNKIAVNNLLQEIYPLIKVTSRRNHGISPLHQLLLTLRFYALGTMLASVADFVGVSKSSAARIVADISSAIAKLYPKYVHFENNTEDDFYKISKFPHVLGVIDCTHIHIQSPSSNIGDEFRNRKGYFSINMQSVCDAHLRFTNVVTRPGSTDNATIFNNSTLKAECENGVYGDRWLIGDNAYPCKPYLLTPVLNPVLRSQQLYNDAHIQTRKAIERCFEVWKRRFPIMGLKLRLSLPNIQSVVIATTVLHNICRQMDIEDVEPEVQISTQEIESVVQHDLTDSIIHEREDLINNYFNSS